MWNCLNCKFVKLNEEKKYTCLRYPPTKEYEIKVEDGCGEFQPKEMLLVEENNNET